jgi:phage tail sheath gpL-like
MVAEAMVEVRAEVVMAGVATEEGMVAVKEAAEMEEGAMAVAKEEGAREVAMEVAMVAARVAEKVEVRLD